MPPKEEKNMISPFLKWISGIVAAIILTSIFYVASSITSLNVEVVGIKRDITYLTQTIQENNRNAYPKAEIIAEFKATNLQVQELSRRIDFLEAKCFEQRNTIKRNNPQP